MCPWLLGVLPFSTITDVPLEQLPPGFPTRRGALVLAHATHLGGEGPPQDELEWLGRFGLIVTNEHGPVAPRARDYLRPRGSRLFFYFWANGFTAGELAADLPDGGWRREVATHRETWLLSPEALAGPPGTPDSYYLDLASDDLLALLCEHLRRYRARAGYDGVFFDFAGAYALPDAAAELWRRRHPGLPYDRALLGLVRRLRRADPGLLVFTNQGLRSTEPLLRAVDYDLTESYATSFAWGPSSEVNGRRVSETFFRPWEGVAGLAELQGAVEKRLRRTPPRRAFFYLDYMQPSFRRSDGEITEGVDQEAVYYSYCAAALWGREAFCSGWHAGGEYRGPLYFADLGRPLGDRPVETGGLVLREYERGLVCLLARPEAAEVTWTLSRPTATLYDLFAGGALPVAEGRVTVRLAPCQREASSTLTPIGRVYLKVTGDRTATAGRTGWAG